MLIDGISAFTYLWLVLQRPEEEDLTRLTKKFGSDANKPPTFVSIIIPVYNAERSIYRCVESLASQTYPREAMEVLCIGNAVDDKSVAMFAKAQRDFRQLSLVWVELPKKGKSRALNAGAFMAKGSLIVNIDADTRLAPDAISKITAAFDKNPDLGAASGSIHVDLVPTDAPWWWKILNACEAMEYLAAFRIGRRYQTVRGAVFTLSGAFSVFRRETVLSTYRYDDKTVSEDTKLTFDVRNLGKGSNRIACISQAEAYVEPTVSIERLNSQRLRWQRGQLEVLSLYKQYYERSAFRAFGDFTGRLLLGDHTLSIPRLTWTFMLPYLFFLGYSLPLVAMAIWVTYFMYVLIDFAFLLAVRHSMRDIYGLDLRAWWFLPFTMPIYRFGVYWFRLAGMLYALIEPANWSTDSEIKRIRQEAVRIWLVVIMLGGSLSLVPQRTVKAIEKRRASVLKSKPKATGHLKANLFTPIRQKLGTESDPSHQTGAQDPLILRDDLPVYSYEEVLDAIAATRKQVAEVVLNRSQDVKELKQRLHYLTCYRRAWELATPSLRKNPHAVHQAALGDFERQKRLMDA